MVSNITLIKIASIGGIIATTTGYLAKSKAQSCLRTTETYKEALDLIRNHSKAVSFLGEPIKEGRINGGRKDEVTWFSVCLEGTNTKGKIYCEVPFTEDSQAKVEISKLEITFDSVPNKVFVVKES